MGTITVVLPDDLIERLRAYMRRRGAKKGDLSRFVSAAVERALQEVEEERVFVALLGGKEVARASSLRELAESLRKSGVDPAEVRVKMIPPPPPMARAGARVIERR